MRVFSALYDKVLGWARHPQAPFYLALLSFTEASFFPIPPDLMLAPMAVSRPTLAWWYAGLTTLSSVLGGVLGYVLGMFFIQFIEPYLLQLGYATAYHQVQNWFLLWGFWALFFAGFMPIPYKIFTIASGAVGMPLFAFIGASLIGRGSRFYLVSALMRLGGEKAKSALRTYIDWVGWILLAVLTVILLSYFFVK